MTPNSTSGWYNKISHSPTLFFILLYQEIRVLKLNAISCYANSTFCAGTTNQPFVLSLVFILLYQNPNFQIICTLSNGMLCYRSNNMYDFSTTKLNRELYLNRVTLPNNMYDFRGVVFCCTDCCREISLVQQNERRVFI